MSDRIIVLKFGGSVLRDRAALGPAVREVYRWVRGGARVVAVVSAFEGVTDALLREAEGVCPEPAHGPTATLLATGELTTAALLGLALVRAGIGAAVLTPQEIGLRVEGDALDAEPVGVDTAAIRARLAEAPVAVVPGFIGVDRGGALRTLGRGGSDLSAIYLAHALRAAGCRLVKDVAGLYERDPKGPGPSPRFFERIGYAGALGLDGGIVQHKAVRFAERLGVAFGVGELHAEGGTEVGPWGPVLRERGPEPGRALRVGILGAGTVGLGVYELLEGLPGRARVVSVACRDRGKGVRAGVREEVVCEGAESLPLEGLDVLVEAVGGIEPAGLVVERALRRGVSVVTANKALVAAWGERLERAAAEGGATLRCSAAVGGGAPVLEGVRRVAEGPGVARVEGVLNATTGAVLAAVERGASPSAALKRARERGLAEADPSRDLEGRDAADKLAVIARVAWGVSLNADAIPRETIDLADCLGRPGRPLRQVGVVERDGNGVRARVELRRLKSGDPLLSDEDAGVVALVTGADGAVTRVAGSGAGRWPTAESVVADVLDEWRARSSPGSAGRSEAVRGSRETGVSPAGV